jgi:hypothetical protein
LYMRDIRGLELLTSPPIMPMHVKFANVSHFELFSLHLIFMFEVLYVYNIKTDLPYRSTLINFEPFIGLR